MWVIDASVAVKWAVAEEDSLLAAEFIGQPLTAPDLFVTECANVFWHKTQRGEIDAQAAAHAMRGILAVGIDMVSAQSLVVVAMEIAHTLKHPVYDCLYVALAEQLDCAFVTADRRFARLYRASTRENAQKRIALLNEMH